MTDNEAQPLTAWSLVKMPAILTLIVTVVRLVGELSGWNEFWFGTGASGAADQGSTGMFGIVWLVPIFGLYFGYRIRKTIGGPRIGRVLALFVVAAIIIAGGVAGLVAMGVVTLADPNAVPPKEPDGLAYALVVLVIGLLVCFAAWGRLVTTLVLYGFLARIPVIVVTWLAVTFEWGTHHGKLVAGAPAAEGMEKVIVLATPQVTFWIVFTVVVGGLFGALGSSFAARSSTD